jgi:patatin-like phospholipase/acyl hydrolase
MTATQILKFYQDYGQTIFKELDITKFPNVLTEVWRRIKEKDPSLPLFEEEGLENVLKKPNIFPETLLFKDLPKPTLVTSYDTYNREAVIFVSQGKNAQNPDDKYKARYAG